MNRYFVGILLSYFFSLALAQAAPETTNFQAHISKPNGQPLESNAVTFTFRYKNVADNCTVFIETYANIDMTGSGGGINLQLGSGVPSFPVAGVTLYDIFNNASTNIMACLEGGTYAPLTTNEGRLFIVEFSYPGSNGIQAISGTTINSVPFAMYASQATNSDQLGGFSANTFARFADFTTCGGGQFLTYNGTVFSCAAPGAQANFTGTLSGDVTGTQGATVVSRLQNTTLSIASPSSGEVLMYNGTAWVAAPVVSSGGTVTAVSSDNTFITVTNPNTTPTLSVNIGTTSGTLVEGDDARITGAWQSASSLSGDVTGTLAATVVSTVGTKTAAEIATSVNDTQAATHSNDPSTIVKRDGSGNATLTGLSATNVLGRNFYLYDITNTDRILLKAPNALTSGDYSFTLPANTGSNGYVLATDGSGNTSWIPASSGSVTDVTASAPLSSTGGPTPNITITQAGAGASGYLTSTDWSVFNAKQAALSAASAANDGYLTSTDWSVFNAKQAALSAASAANDGYLTSTDWSLFNSKISGITSGDIHTALALPDGFVRSTSGVLSAASLTSGEIVTALGYTPGNAAGTLNTLNGQTGVTQSFAFDASGSDFAIQSSNDIHTFSIPTASAGARGLLSSADWSIFSAKQDAMIAASAANDGYLTSSDWSLFNSKISGITSGDVITALGYTPGNAAGTLNTLNGQTGVTQSFAFDASGSDFAIQSSNDIHTFSIPTASAGARGLLSSADWSIFSAKQDAMVAASAANDGYLTSTDWSLFNSKISGITSGDIHTALALPDGFVRSTSGVLSAASLTSGEIVTALGYTPGNAAGTLSTLNGQTGVTQSFAAGTAGSDFVISSSGDVHTFDIPTASAGARGLLSSADWSSFSAKQDAMIAASAANDGYLTSSDWSLFNSKISGITSGDVITALGYTPGNAAGTLSTLNGQTGVTQSFAFDASGSDFAIQSSNDIHTFSIPTASAGARGLLSSADWSIFSAKQDAMVAASAANDGYLTSTDWSLFNSKISGITSGDIHTALALPDGFVRSTSGVLSAATLTSGEVITALGYTPSAGSGLTSLNGQTGTNQNFAAGTAGSDFVISSSGDVHTFDIPTASAGARGLLSSADWSIFSAKQDAMVAASAANDGYLTSSDWSIFNNKQNALLAATASNDGYLTSSDWSIFNSKISGITSGDVITALGYTPGNAAGTLSTLNGQTGVTQSFAFDASGSDFAIQSSNDIHTFSIPTASAGARGLLSSADWSIFNSKISGITSTDINTALALPDGFVRSTSGVLSAASLTSGEIVTALGYTPGNAAGTLSTLNGQTGVTQSFAAGTAGSDFVISSSGDVHTFDIPTASAGARGLLSSADWSSFSAKQDAMVAASAANDGYLTSSDWSIFNNKQDALLAATASNDGYLTSSDWSLFNSKISGITSGDVITALGYTPGNAAGTLSTLMAKLEQLKVLQSVPQALTSLLAHQAMFIPLISQQLVLGRGVYYPLQTGHRSVQNKMR